MPRLQHPPPEKRVEPARLNRHAQPPPRLELKVEEDTVEVLLLLGTPNDHVFAAGAVYVPLHLGLAQASPKGNTFSARRGR